MNEMKIRSDKEEVDTLTTRMLRTWTTGLVYFGTAAAGMMASETLRAFQQSAFIREYVDTALTGSLLGLTYVLARAKRKL